MEGERDVQWWHAVMLMFVAAWFLQIILSYFQSRHYQETVREMAAQDSGYLGVGVVKRKMGIGSVVILVTDPDFVVTNAKEITGVTVFGRFKQSEGFIGRQIDDIERSNGDDSRCHAAKKAVQLIKQQVIQVLSAN
jgi:glucitol operon activator protein